MKVTFRESPLEDVEHLAKNLRTHENLSVASPVLDIEDFDNFVENCQGFKMPHNIHNWKNYKHLKLRVYKNIRKFKQNL